MCADVEEGDGEGTGRGVGLKGMMISGCDVAVFVCCCAGGCRADEGVVEVIPGLKSGDGRTGRLSRAD